MNEQVRILCVDDEVNVLKALQRLFLDDDYEILLAASAAEGLEILANAPSVQIIISDFRMPGINGVEFLREVCRRWPDTVRIVLSGYADTAAVVSAINEGQIYKFIPKPWNDDELRVTILNAIDRHYLNQKNIELMNSLAKTNAELQVLNENLEKLVTERTRELLLHNRVLKYSQNILDSLPIAVFGLDPEGRLVQCNRKGHALLGGASGVLGNERRAALPAEVNLVVDEVLAKGETDGRIIINGIDHMIKGVTMDDEEQQGVIVILD